MRLAKCCCMVYSRLKISIWFTRILGLKFSWGQPWYGCKPFFAKFGGIDGCIRKTLYEYISYSCNNDQKCSLK